MVLVLAAVVWVLMVLLRDEMDGGGCNMGVVIWLWVEMVCQWWWCGW